MALIKCPSCAADISDKAVSCPQCGILLKKETKKSIICEDCGNELNEDATVCTKCGCPVEVKGDITESVPQPVEITSIKVPKVRKNIKKILIGVALVFIVALAGIKVYEVQKASKEAEEYAKVLEEYDRTLRLVTETMLSGASKAETGGNLIKKVWYNAIYKESDSETDEYTKPRGYFVDFNEAIDNLLSYGDVESFVIEDKQNTVKKSMQRLQNPPVEYEDEFEALKQLYDAFVDLTNLIVKPSGNFQSYSSNFNDAVSEFVKCYDALEMLLGE